MVRMTQKMMMDMGEVSETTGRWICSETDFQKPDRIDSDEYDHKYSIERYIKKSAREIKSVYCASLLCINMNISYVLKPYVYAYILTKECHKGTIPEGVAY